MGPLLNAVRLQALRATANQMTCAYGEVTSYNPATFAVKVLMHPEEVITGWLPLASPWIGSGWGMFAAPSIGDLVAVHFARGEIDAGIAEARFFSDQQRPLAVPSGEFWLVHRSGSSLKFTNDGAVTINGNLTVNGSITATGNVTGQGTSLHTHTHSGVQGGSSNTGAPN